MPLIKRADCNRISAAIRIPGLRMRIGTGTRLNLGTTSERLLSDLELEELSNGKTLVTNAPVRKLRRGKIPQHREGRDCKSFESSNASTRRGLA